MWALISVNLAFLVAFLVLLVDVYNTTRLFRAPQGKVVTKTEIPSPHQARVFRVFCIRCSYDPLKQTLLLELAGADDLVNFMGTDEVLCILDSYAFNLKFAFKAKKSITLIASPLEGAPLCFTQLTAYANLSSNYAQQLVGSTLVLLLSKK